MKQTSLYITTVSAVAALVLSYGCSAVRECKSPEIAMPQSEIYARTDSLTLADMGWWEFCGDGMLREIIERTLANNKRILGAAAKVEQARRMYGIARAERMPNFYFEAPFNNETNDYYDEKPIR